MERKIEKIWLMRTKLEIELIKLDAWSLTFGRAVPEGYEQLLRQQVKDLSKKLRSRRK